MYIFFVSKSKHHVMKMYGRMKSQILVFLTSEMYWGKWSASRSSRFYPTEMPPVLIGYDILGAFLSQTGHGDEEENHCPC
jgi:hypothetical protein